MLQAAGAGAPTIRILSDDTHVFVLLMYCIWKANVSFCSADGEMGWHHPGNTTGIG